MNKGISFHFGYVYKNQKQQVNDIKAAGFNCYIDNADPKYKFQNGSFVKRVSLFRKQNIIPSSLHSKLGVYSS